MRGFCKWGTLHPILNIILLGAQSRSKTVMGSLLLRLSNRGPIKPFPDLNSEVLQFQQFHSGYDAKPLLSFYVVIFNIVIVPLIAKMVLFMQLYE